MKLYVAIDGKKEGPLSFEVVAEKFRSGQLKAENLAWKSGVSEWKPLIEICPELLETPEEQEQPKKEEEVAEKRAEPEKKAVDSAPATETPSSASGMTASGLAGTAKMFALRFIKSDFQKQSVTSKEAAQLEAANPPIHAKDAGNFLAWRRSLLWIVGICTGITTLLSLLGLGALSGQPSIVWFVTLLKIAGLGGASFLAILAAIFWTNVPRTRKLARFSWACMFLVPFGVALIPITFTRFETQQCVH